MEKREMSLGTAIVIVVAYFAWVIAIITISIKKRNEIKKAAAAAGLTA